MSAASRTFLDEFLKAALKSCHILTTRHHVIELIPRNLAFRKCPEAVAVIEHGETVAGSVGVMNIMRDKDHREAPITCLDDELKYGGCLFHAECRRGLVKDQYPGPEVNRPGNCEGLAFAAR